MVRLLPDRLWAALGGACSEVRSLSARSVLTRAGEPVDHSALLIDGIMVRYVAGVTPATGKPLTVALQVPGDFVDLHALPLGQLDHDVCTLTPARIAFFPHEALRDIMAENAEDSRALWRLTMIDAAIHRHWTYRSGRLRAMAAVADFFCEMHLRMLACDRVTEQRFYLGLMQSDLADLVGLSPVHVNRVLKDLRDGDLCVFQGGYVEIRDWVRLQKLAGYDPGYLFMDDPP